MLIFDRDPGLMFLRALVALLVAAGTAVCQECQYQQAHQFDYSQVFALERSDNFESFVQLPGHTRSRYQPKYGLIAPESRVWAASGAWPGCKTAHLLSDNGSHFSMYLVVASLQGKDKAACGSSGTVPKSLQRFTLVVEGSVVLQPGDSAADTELHQDMFAFCPSADACRTQLRPDAAMLVFERMAPPQAQTPGAARAPEVQIGKVADVPTLETAPEMFALRKLLPQTSDYIFNVHVMDFQPGEHLVVHEVHYNVHGLLMLQGQGVYRLNGDWHSVRAGDAIWMGAYVPQWYGALGRTATRYILYKDTTLDPLTS